MEDESTILFKEESYRILGACFEVYKEKGCGFSEALYHECLGIEFELQEIPAISEPRMELAYKGRTLSQRFEPDFLCFGKVILEIKALPLLTQNNQAQAMNYLKGSGLKLALLVNFGHHPRLEYKRLAAHNAWTPESSADLRS